MCLQYYIITREKLRPFHIPGFSNLHYIGAPAFRRPQLGNLHLMEEHSVIRFYLKKAANIEENAVSKVINVWVWCYRRSELLKFLKTWKAGKFLFSWTLLANSFSECGFHKLFEVWFCANFCISNTKYTWICVAKTLLCVIVLQFQFKSSWANHSLLDCWF